MNWIILSILMIVCSVTLYLFVRKSQLLKTPTVINNLAMYAIPCVIFFFINIVQKNSLVLSWQLMLLIFLAAIVLNYLGNLMSLHSIRLSTNPGYSLIITKSYVVLTSILSLFLFHSPLSLKNAMAIVLIILFSLLIMINKSTKQSHNMNWLFLAIGSFFAFGFFALASKYFINQGVNIVISQFYICLFVSIVILVELFFTKRHIDFKQLSWPIILCIGISCFAFNLSMQLGYKFAPNPGYINAANAASISLLTLLSAYFYKDQLSLRKVVGVMGVTGGLILLFV